MSETKEYYTVKEFAKLCGVTPRTLKYYEELGLISPAQIGSENKYRYYNYYQSDQVSAIKFYQELGLSLKEIKHIETDSSMDTVEKRMLMQRGLLSKRLEALQLQERIINYSLSHLQEAKKGLNCPVIKEINRKIVYSPLHKTSGFVVNFISNGHLSGVRMDAKSLKPLGTFQDITDMSPSELLTIVSDEEAEIQTITGRQLSMYHNSYPMKSKKEIEALKKEATKRFSHFSHLYCVQILENVEGDGLFLYTIVEDSSD